MTSGLGAILAVIGLIVLLKRASALEEPWLLGSYAIYGATLVVFYLVSTLYHSTRQPNIRFFFRVLDHISIFLLIAGTYTPFCLVSLGEGLGWSLFWTVWGVALAGTIFKVFTTGRLRLVAPLLYIGMGWLAVVAWDPLLAAVTPEGMGWLLAGGLAYTVGVIFYAWNSLPFNHPIWHLFVLAGSACHFVAIYRFV